MRGKLHEDNAEQVKSELEFARRCGNQYNGIYYSGELAGPGGMSYWLFPAEGTSDEVIEEAERQLRADQDVVSCDVIFVPPEMVMDDERDKPCADASERIAKIRKIVEEKSFNKVEGVSIDLFSASAIIAVYDVLNAENKAKYAALPIRKMATVAFKLVK